MPTKWLFAQLFSFRNWWFLDYLLSFAFLSFEESSSMSIFTLMGRKPSSQSPLEQLMDFTMFSSISDAKHRLSTQSVLSWFSCQVSLALLWSYQSMCNFVTCNSLVWNAYSMANNKTPHIEMPTTWQIVSCNSLVWNAYKMAYLLGSFLSELRGSSAMSVSKLSDQSRRRDCYPAAFSGPRPFRISLFHRGKKFMTVKHVTRHQSSAMSIFTLMGRKPSSWSPLPQLMYLTMFSSISDAKHRLTTQSVLSWFSCKRSPWHYYKVINQCAIFLLAGLNTDVTPADNKRLPNTENQDLKYVFKKISMIVNLKGSSNGVLFNLAYFVKDIMNAFKE